MTNPVALQVDYVGPEELQGRPSAWWQDVLAVVCFDDEPIAPPRESIPCPQVTSAVLGTTGRCAEIWRLPGPMSSGQLGRVHYRRAERLLFASLRVYEHEFPAAIAGAAATASTLGARSGSALTVYCIAGLRPPISLENPRQCSAWQYPRRYGPRPPTFARACLDGTDGQTLYISGTASIVGHRSEHAGDALAQTRETLRNIGALIDTANARLGHARHQAGQLRYKVFVRHGQDQPGIEQELRGAVGHEAQALFLQADICRRELLVEIEAVGL